MTTTTAFASLPIQRGIVESILFLLRAFHQASAAAGSEWRGEIMMTTNQSSTTTATLPQLPVVSAQALLDTLSEVEIALV